MASENLIAPIPLGGRGLYGGRSSSRAPVNSLIEADGVTFQDGTVRKEGGASKYNASALSGTPAVIGGWDWWPSAGTQRSIVVTDAGAVLRDTGAGTYATTLASSLTISNTVPVFVEGGKEAAAGNRKLFLFTGANSVQVLSGDGTSMSAITTAAADWTGANQPTGGFIHLARLWAFGNANDPHRLYYSMTSDHEDMTGSGSGSISVYPGEGEKIVAGFAFRDFVIALKFPRGVYLIDTRDSDSSKWRVSPLTRGIGGAGLGCFAQIESQVLFLDSVGAPHALARTGDETFDIQPIARDAEIRSFLAREANLAQLWNTRSIWYEARNELHFAIAGSGATENTRRLVLDFGEPGVIRPRYTSRDTCESLWLRKDGNDVQRPVSGDDAGFVWLMDEATRSKDSVGFLGSFQTPHIDLSHLDPDLASVRKNGKWLELLVVPIGNWNLNVDVFWDDAKEATYTFNMGSTGATLGSFVLGTDALAGDELVYRRRRITGSGRRFSMTGRNSGAGQDFSVVEAMLHFTPGSDRL